MRSNKTVWYWTSVEPALFQKSTFREMAKLGINVREGFTVSEAAFRRRRGTLGRILLRFRMYVEHPLRLGWAALTGNPDDAHIVTTNPFFAPLVAALAARRGSRVIHLVFDTFPDALVVAGKLPADGLATRVIRGMVRAGFDRATQNVFIGRWLLEHANQSFGRIPNAVIIPVGADASAFAGRAPTALKTGQTVDVLYSGTLGNMHDVDTLLGAAAQLGVRGVTPPATFTFHAFGPGYRLFCERVRAMHGVESWLRLESALPDDAWIERMRAAHVALVTMKTGSEAIVMPSKAYSALAAGQAILAVCPKNSDLADLVESRDCGWVVAPGDVAGLLTVLDELSSQPDLLQRKRGNAYRAGQSEFSEIAMAERWIELLRKG